ncbi:retention module-containing protein [Aeromonas caviae]|uniref:retention module-containing protein n=1 Tax=Aeromonas caviae TaxID=648 RepID=UPI0024487A82|nr:retention module-containing protein [Aeromonas caviae]MDH0474713.1 retention module-containing protein [Aeromonas caviae]
MRTQIIDKTVVVSSVEGNVQILLADGSSRPLQPGEILQPGARLNIADDAKLMLAPYDDSPAPADAAPAGPDVPADGQPSSSVATRQPGSPEVSPEIAALQESILQGVDPTQNFEAAAAGGAPAAGGGGGIGGVAGASGNGGFVVIDRIGDATIAAAGFDTSYAALTPQDVLQEDDLLPDNELDDLDESSVTLEDQAVSGNLLDNSTNPDGPLEASIVSYSWGSNLGIEAGVESTLDGIGTLIINADGSYTFTPAPNYSGSVPPVNYVVTDGADTAVSILTVTITPVDEPVSLEGLQVDGGELVLDEAALADGSNPNSSALTKSGTFTFNAADGVQSLTLGGVVLVNNGQVITGFPQAIPSPLGNQLLVTGISYNPVTGIGSVSYSYTLNDNEVHNQPANDTALTESFNVVLTDSDSDSTSASLDVVIRDDIPSTKDDAGGTVTEDVASSLNGNVLSNDVVGADTPAAFAGWNASGHDNQTALTALNTYGTFTQNSDGTWAYELDNTRAATQALTAGSSLSYDVWYTMTDSDGDQSIAKLTINIQGADDTAKVTVAANGADTTVFEAGLNPNGSAAQTNAETDGSTFQVFASDGIKQLVIGGTTFTVAQLQDPAYLAAHPINTGEGTLTLTGFSSADGKTAVLTYSYTLDAAQTHTKSDSDTRLTDQVLITLDGVGGSTASGTLKIEIIDDSPTPSVTANAGGTAALTVSLDETTGASDHYALGEAADSYVIDDVPGALARVTTALNGGLLGLFNINGSYGADGIGSQSSVVSFQGVPVGGLATNLVATDGGAITLVSSNPTLLNGVDGDGDTVFTIAIVSVGGGLQLQTTLFEALDNGNNSLYDEAVQLLLGQGSTLSLQLQVTRTDGDGDTVVASDTVLLANHITSAFSFDDDAPVGSDYTGANFAEGSGAHYIGSATTVLGISSGEDGLQGTLQGIVFTNQGVTGGTLAIDGSGNLIYTSPGNVTSGAAVTETFLYTVTDKDGDAITRTVTFGVTDTGVTIGAAPVNLLADEDNLAAGVGNTTSPGDDAQVLSGTISYTLGQDAIGSITLSTAGNATGLQTLAGQDVVTTFSNGTLIGYISGTNSSEAANQVFAITLGTLGASATGYTMTLFQPVKHASAGTEDNTTPFTVNVVVADADGSTANTSFTVSIDDDMPITTNDGLLATLSENSSGTTIGTMATLLGDDNYGADGAATTGSLVIGTGDRGGTVTIDVNGNLVYTNTSQNVVQGETVTETFTYTIKDADGDTAEATFTVNLTDTGVTIGAAPVNLLADEDNLAAGVGNTTSPGDDAQVLSGTISYTLGQDAIGSITLSTAGNATGLQTLAGQDVVTTFSNGTLIGYISGTNSSEAANQVFAITLGTLGASATGYTMTLFQPVKHASAGTEDNTTPFTVNVVVADADGSTANTSFTVSIDDDMPITTNDGLLATLSENSSGTTIGTMATLLGDDNYGADGAATTGSLVIGTGDRGGTVTIDVNGNLVYTNTSQNVVQGETVTETFTYTIKDADGDTAEATFTVNLTDTGVTIGAAPVNLLADEDNLAAGVGNTTSPGDDAQVLSGTISYTLGQDAIGSITLSTAGNATGLQTLAGQDVVTTFSNGTLIGYISGTNSSEAANQVFAITLGTLGASATGYTMTLFQPVKHASAGTEDNTTPFTVNVVVADADGSTANTSFTVSIDDDMPITTNDGLLATLSENSSGTTIGTMATLLGDDNYGADGAATTGSLVIGTGDRGGTVTIDVNGNLVYTNTSQNVVQGETVTETFTYTIKDADGDTAEATFTVNLTDTGVTIGAAPVNLLADEDNLAAGVGNTTSPGDDAQVLSGTISYTLGQDAIGSITLSTAGNATGLQTLAGQDVVTTFSNGTLIGYISGTNSSEAANQVFAITLGTLGASATGYTMTLFQPVKHASAGTEDNTTPFTVNVVVADADGSTANTSFTVSIDDDMPITTNDGLLATLSENSSGTTIGTMATLLGDDNYGADGAATTGSLVIGTGDRGGTVTIDVNGNLVYTNTSQNVVQGETVTETFTYTIKDADGDTAEATFTVNLTDTGVTIGAAPVNLLADEDNLAAGVGNTTSPGDDAQVLSGTISYTLGQDAIGSITLSTAGNATGLQTLAGQDVVTTFSNGTLIGYISGTNSSEAANQVFAITLGTLGASATGYTMTLFQPVKHASAGTEDNTTPFTVNVVVADADGSTANTSFTVSIDDDMPITTNDGLLATLSENSSGTTIGTMATLLGDDNYGADGAATTGSLVIGTGDRGGTVTIDVNGNLVYTNTSQNVVQGETVTETFTYTIKDADGDTAEATFTVNLTDTGVTIGAAPVNLLADEDNLAAGVGNTTSPGDDAQVLSGTISYTLGQDAIGSITLSTAGNATGLQTLAGQDVVTTFSNGTLIGYISGTNSSEAANQVFAITLGTLGASATGYTMTLFQPVKHASAGTEDNTTPFTVNVVVADADGSTANTSFTVSIDDDMPITTNDGLLATLSENSSGTTIGTMATLLGDDNYGADGAATTGSLVIGTGDRGGTVTIDVNGNLVYTNTSQNVVQGETVTETFTYTIKDADGDTAEATFTVNLTDTGVTIGAAPVNLLADEDNLAAGVGNTTSPGDDAQVLSGTISYTLGQDAIGSITLSTAGNATGLQTLAGQDVVTTFSNGTLIGYISGTNSSEAANQVFAITLGTLGASATGYTMTLFQPVKHASAGTEDNTTPFTVNVVVADADGSTANTSFTVSIDDDMPITTNDGLLATLSENSSGTTIGTMATLLGDDNYGADGAATTGSLVIGTGDRGGTVTIDVNGNLVYTNTSQNVVQGETVTETFTYTIKDADGDTAEATFTVNLTDTGVTIGAAPVNLLADEDNLAAGVGNTTSPGDDAQVLSGTISYTLGQDAIGSITLSTAGNATGLQTLAGQDVVTTFSNGTLIGYISGTNSSEAANQVFAITLGTLGASATGYTMTLFQPVKHASAGTEDNTTPFTVNVVVADADGSTANTSFTVSIDDDMPITTNDGLLATLSENSSGTTIGTMATLLGDDNYGADGAATTGSLVIGTGDRGGTVTIDVNGNLVYTNTSQNVVQGETVTETFTYTIKDADGDTAEATFTVNLTDTGVTIGAAPVNLLADEDNLAAGVGNTTSPGDDAQVLSGTISYTLGQDAIGSITLSTAGNATGLQTLAGQDVVTTFSNGTLIGYISGTNSSEAANQVFAITLGTLGASATGYTMTLFQPVKHASAGTEDNTTPFTVNVVVADADGSTANTSFTVTIDDDMPVTTGSAHHGYVANSVNTSVTGDLAISFGADGFGSYSFDTPLPNVTSGGRTIEYVQTGNVLTGYVDANNNDTVENGEQAFRLQLNTNGTYTFTLLKQLDAPETVGIGGSSSFGSGPAQGQLLTNTGGTLQLAVLQGWMTNNSWTSADFDNWQTQGVLNAAHVDQASVNGSTAGWGVDNNNFNSSEILRMDFNNYSSFDGATLPSAFDGPAVNYATIQLVGFAQTEKVAYVIHYEDNTFEAGNGTVATLAGADLTMTLGSGKYIDYIELLDVESGGGGKFQLVNLSTVTNTGTLNMEFGIKATDADGDTTNQAIAVTVDGSNPIDGSTANDSLAGDAGSNTINALAGNDILDGSSGHDILDGGDGNDVLIGGFGNDTLTGGAGKDTFKWQSGESGGTDVIKDFTTGTNGDVLDLSELLSGEHANATSLDQYLNFASGPGANKSTLTIDLDGSAGGTTTHTIFFDNVDLTANSTRTDLQIIQDLLDQGNLKVDP